MLDKNLNQIFIPYWTLNQNLVKALMGIYELHISLIFLRNVQQNKQTLWVILERFWQKTNLKSFILSVYNEVKTKYLSM